MSLHGKCCNGRASVALTILDPHHANEREKYERLVKPLMEALLGAYVGAGITDKESAAVDLLTDIGLYMRLDGFRGEYATGYDGDSVAELFLRVRRAVVAELAEMNEEDADA